MQTPIRLEARNPGPMTGEGNHTYLVHGPRRTALLVDAGTGEPDHLEEVRSALERSGARLSDVLVTHGHHDHVSGSPRLHAAHPGVRFHKWPWTEEEDSRHSVHWNAIQDGSRFALADGDWLESLHTPGHAPDHVVFWHPESATLFAGDLVLPGATVVIQWSRGGDMAHYLDSLRRVIALRPRRLFPAHGPDVADPIDLLDATLRHRLAREAQVAQRVADGVTGVQAIVESIYHGLPPAHEAAARENVRSHLEKLRREGRVTIPE